ncbi:MAG: GNAT family N-acetyltransferase [Clostridia bacterium]|nr:GNAT family N-acetyltransferase [Clostridia bacterium]
MNQQISFELLSEDNIEQVRAIQRDDISEAFVDHADTIMELTQYGIAHNCKGHTFAVKCGDEYIGLILLGEAFEWDTDPEEMKGVPFYRLMGFVLDKRYRNCGIGGYVLERVIEAIYSEYGVRPIALGVHKDNVAAARFYLKHGFCKTNAMEGNDYYYLRYPQG